MDLPDWIIDEILSLPDVSSIRILFILLKHSHQALAAQGIPAYKATLSASSLAREAKVSRAGAYRGLAHLEEMGIIEVYQSWKSREPNSYLIPWDKSIKKTRGPPVAQVRKSPERNSYGCLTRETLNNNGGVDDLSPDTRTMSSTTPIPCPTSENPDSETRLIQQLRELGFTNAEAFVAQHPAERIEAAIEYVNSPPTEGISNPAGFIRYLVESEGAIPVPVEKRDPNIKYIKGRYGHIVKR